MKYFTRKFITGAWDETRRKAAIAGYAQRLGTLGLSPPLEALSRLALHDAYVLSVMHNASARTLKVVFRHGDLQVGYQDATLKFYQAIMSEKSLQTIKAAERPSNVWVRASELDVRRGCGIFRLLLWPTGEFTVRFKEVSVESKAVPGRRSP